MTPVTCPPADSNRRMTLEVPSTGSEAASSGVGIRYRRYRQPVVGARKSGTRVVRVAFGIFTMRIT